MEGSAHGSASPFRPPRRAGGFDFTGHMRQVCEDLVTRVPQLGHIQLDRILIVLGQARKRSSHGLFASLTPLRFRGGALTERRRGRLYTVQRLFDRQQHEFLYILTFYLPRFLELDFRAKLVTVVHELWHISPECNGDLRRHPGRCFAHTHSQRNYDADMEPLVDRWLAAGAPESLCGTLRGNFASLLAQHGRIHGLKVRRPKLVPLP